MTRSRFRAGRLFAALAALVAAAPAWAAEVPFEERVVSAENTLVRSISAADIDGDGDVDILAGIADDGDVAWFENDGGYPLSFTKRVVSTYHVRQPAFIRAADMNADGHLDILSIGIGSDQVMWFRNDGQPDPSFTEHTITIDPDDTGPLQGPANGVRQIVVSDLDGDGDLDVAAAAVANSSVTWYESDGADPPAWTPRTITFALLGARALEAGDFDDDGDMDIVAGGWYDPRLVLYENDGAQPPGFIARTIYEGPGQLVTWRTHPVDLDQDGDLDVITARGASNGANGWVDFYENTGGTPLTWVRHVISDDIFIGKSVYSADLDDDGDLDVISASIADDKIAWFENLGGSPMQWTQHVLTEDPDGPCCGSGGPIEGTADGARSVWADDLDNDGDLEVIWCSRLNDTVAYHESLRFVPCLTDLDGGGTTDLADILALLAAWGPCPLPPDPCPADLSGDGIVDIADLLDLLAAWGPCP